MQTILQPQNTVAEKNVIGAILIDNSIILDVIEQINSQDFYQSVHREIFKTIEKFSQAHEPIDIVTISDGMKSCKELENAGGLNFLVEIANNVPTTANTMNYVKIVSDQSKRRKLLNAANMISNGIEGNLEIEEIIEVAEKDILSINENNNIGFSSIDDVITNAIVKLEERCNRKGQIIGVPTGFYDLDFKLGGLQKGDLIIIAARPSMGKTSLAENIATFASGNKQLPCAFFSMEMSKEKIMNRILSGWAHIDNAKIRLGTLDDTDWEKIGKAMAPVSNIKMIIDDTSNLKASEIRARCRRIKNSLGGLGLVVVDHLTEMWRPNKGSPNFEHEENVRAMKRLAKELNCPVILLQQLNRGVEQRADKRPMLSDLRETGVAEEVADVVMFIYRDDYYNPNTDKKNIAEVIIAKGRDTGIGTIELAWLGQFTKFANLEKRRG